ncbi:hypothetical protein D3C75_799650 [compost metagenome]
MFAVDVPLISRIVPLPPTRVEPLFTSIVARMGARPKSSMTIAEPVCPCTRVLSSTRRLGIPAVLPGKNSTPSAPPRIVLAVAEAVPVDS